MIGALGVVPVLVAVVARWLAFAMDPTLRDAIFLVPALPAADLAFTGGRILLSPPTLTLAVFLVVSTVAFGPHRARARAAVKLEKSLEEVDALNAVLPDLLQSMIRERLKPDQNASEMNRLADDAERYIAAAELERTNVQAAMQEMKRITLPSDNRTYPIRRFGWLFASRWVVLGLIFGALYFLAGLVLTGFPSGFVTNLTMVGSVLLLLRAAVSADGLGLSSIAPSVILAIAGATASGAFEYRAPIGIFQWETAVGPPGRYAHVGAADDTTYLVSCDTQDEGVLAIPSSVIDGVTFVSTTEPRTGPNLVELVAGSDRPLLVGPLLGCRSP